MFSNFDAQSFHEADLESKFVNFENARDSMNDLCRLCEKLLAIVAALAVEPPTAAGDSSQLASWSCQPVSKYVTRIPVPTIPEDVTTSAHVYQRATQESTS